METEKRIKKVIQWLIFKGFAENERDLSERLGYTKSSFSQLVNGKVPLSDKFVGKLCALDPNINPVWITKGEGDIFLSECNGNGNNSNSNNNWSNVNTDAALLRALDEIGEQRKLAQTAQEQVSRLIEVIANMNSK